ncbi:TetR family transcriptional regulator [Sphaerisporangium melleum]|uniref:TetR family transcriptional regulator n=1 Tax=Sphaerisporangium melleum TaxID=321316 RepID=A0A917VIQ4_9ACTN|nr:TetR family transcriptional regulator [Sphaerisporangium melleum]GGK87545.1 TetR family transcriptional regulator [Sphaerisporangium melleum]GII72419.1 TetR family transcriptional regulator [Sphaerisporangium melleum]
MDSGTDERVGLRERKKRQTRIALGWAAIRLVVERGWDAVRVEDIAAEAGVSPRTFNNYFSGKAEAVVSRHLDRYRLIAEEFRARPASEPLWEAITNAALARFALEEGTALQEGTGLPEGAGLRGVSHQEWVSGLRLMLAEPALQGEFHRAAATAEAELAAAVADRTGTDPARDLYPRLVAAAVGAAITVAMDHWMRSDPPVPMMPLLRDALRQVAAGLPAPGSPPA